MDVRCEKCQTEYELDEQRLKPGGVTVKCTNCGHMFKIRKRTTTNVGAPLGDRAVPTSRTADHIDAGLDSEPTRSLLADEGPAVERQWIIRLENGEQKSCRELATLQQWIVGHVVSRESMISRTGKTWKRLGDIAELAQYFDIADEARGTRDHRPTKPTGRRGDPVPGTMIGIGAPPVGSIATAVGGTIQPDDDEVQGRTTGSYSAVPGSTKTPPMGSNVGGDVLAPPPRRPITTPPPPPNPRPPTGPV
ncbi:MAG: zinc-ribbon domain-containing protein, partial [Myxococcota bacterium]|nr:zinc-ribbon domain-containing protein [Myxococcota bacterium]